MEAFSFLIQASEDGFIADLKYNAGKRFDSLKSPLRESEVVDAILQLKDDTVVDKPSHYNIPVSVTSTVYHVERRPRAMSEPNVQSSKRIPFVNHYTATAHRLLHKPSGSLTYLSSTAANVPTLEEYPAICNKNGRIGVYTKEERVVLIARYRAKRNRRVWKKKIRYECRKDLADKRSRVKGRFVKRGKNSDEIDSQGSEENNTDTSGTHDDLQDLKVNDDGGGDRLSFLASILGEFDEENDDEEEEEENQQPRKRMRRHSIAY